MVFHEKTAPRSHGGNHSAGWHFCGLRLWADYLRDVSDEARIETFLSHAKQKTGFTDFYFISREGSYRTIDGETGYLDLKDDLPELIFGGQELIVNAVVPGRPQIMVLASHAAPGSYRGFAYEAIAISFDNADVVKALEISAFDGSAESYIIHADGRVVVDNAPSQEKIYNFLAALKKSSDLDDGEIAGL